MTHLLQPDRLLSITELRSALSAVRDGDAAHPREQIAGPTDGRPWVAVLGAHGGAGSTTVALALAHAAADPGTVHLVSLHGPDDCGLLAAASEELGCDETGQWRTGRRGPQLVLTRPTGTGAWGPTAWPDLPENAGVTIADTVPGQGQHPARLRSAAAVVVVARGTLPGLARAERLLSALLPHRPDRSVLLAVLGAPRRHGSVASGGPLAARLREGGLHVAFPVDRHLAVFGPDSRPLPRVVLRAGQLAWQRLAPALEQSAIGTSSDEEATGEAL